MKPTVNDPATCMELDLAKTPCPVNALLGLIYLNGPITASALAKITDGRVPKTAVRTFCTKAVGYGWISRTARPRGKKGPGRWPGFFDITAEGVERLKELGFVPPVSAGPLTSPPK